MASQKKPKSIRWDFHLPRTASDHQLSVANAAHGEQESSEYTATALPPIETHFPDVFVEDADQNRAEELPQAGSLIESTPNESSTAPSIAPSTDTASNHHIDTSSTSLANSIFQSEDLDGGCCTTETRPTLGLSPAIEVIEICQGTFVAVTQEPGKEEVLKWRALSKRIHMALAKTCRRYPNLSLKFKLAGATADRLQPVVLLVCPPETQKQVRKFLKKHKWLSVAECGYESMVIDGHFLRVALEEEGGLDGGLFIRTDMDDVETLCGKLGRLEGALDNTTSGSRFTIGGVMVVNDTLCCLTTGHVLFDPPETSEMESSDEEGETGNEDRLWGPANVGQPTTPSRTDPNPGEQMSADTRLAHSQVKIDTRIGRLLTTSNWKRGVRVPNEDWSLIRLDALCSTDERIVNQFHHPGTEVQDPGRVTINKLARTEDDMTEAEVVILAGCTGLQKGRLNTMAVQLYLDNATFEAREIVTHEPLKMGDSGSWVVRGSMLLGHVFAVQDKTRWSYMIPIMQVIDDIQKSLLTYSIELPTPENRGRSSWICPEGGQSHASQIAFGVGFCPTCKKKLRSLGQHEGDESSPNGTRVEKADYPRDDDNKNLSLEDIWESSSTVPASHYSSTVPTSQYSSTVPTSQYSSTVATSHYSSTVPSHSTRDIHYIPISGETISFDEFASPKLRNGASFACIALEAVLDEVDPRNHELIERLIKTDPTVVFNFDNPIIDNVKATRICLMTRSLNNALRHVVRWDPGVNQRFDQIVIHEPYEVLVRHFDKLTAYASELRSVHAAEKSAPGGSGLRTRSASAHPEGHSQQEDIEALVKFTRRYIDAANVAAEISRHDRNACTFSKLWLLFYPGQTVYAKSKNSKGLDAYVVSLCHAANVLCGYRLLDGERDVTSLKVFPCEYLDKIDGGKYRHELEDRGRRWYQLLRGGSTYYNDGLPAELPNHHEGLVAVDRGAVRSRRLDPHDPRFLPINDKLFWLPDEGRAALEYAETMEQKLAGFPWAHYGQLDPDTIEDLELPDGQAEGKGHRYLLCASYLPGFLMKRKDWAWVDVNRCFPLKLDPHALDRLFKPERAKEILLKLVQDAKQPSGPGMQVSPQLKRSGKLIILLHGRSGTGKRYTSECLAEAEGKVLMTIEPGEIASYVLSAWLRLAEKIGAIVFIPTADKYVEKVPMAVGERSDVQSAFWACIEEYRGLVILTTNRIFKFDEAAFSRINLPIYCAPFDSETRQKIGMQLLRQRVAENDLLKIRPEASRLWKSTLGVANWNGHEIKSVLESALALARSRHARGESGICLGGLVAEPQDIVLEEDDIMAVVESRKQFETYLET